MIHFSHDLPRPGNFINSCETDRLIVNGREFRHSLWLTLDQLRPWGPTSFEQLDGEALAPLLATPADLVLLGCGARQRFLPMALLAPFYQRRIGIEVMSSQAACRTFNILTAEGRRPLAGIILEAAPANP